MPVITISRQHGARASVVVTTLAEKKGLEVAYKRDIERHLRSIVGGFLAEKYSSETSPTFLDTVMYNMELWRGLLSEAIFSIANRGNVIIYGRGGSFILRGIPGVVHVLIVGNRKKRIQHIAETNQVSFLEAEEIIDEIEKRREGFHSHHFGESWPDPGNFDLTLNPLNIGMDRCADIISALVDTPSLSEDFRKRGRKMVAEKYVEVSAGNRIALFADLDHNFFDVSLRKGKEIVVTFYDVPAAVRKTAVSAVADFHRDFKVIQTDAGHPKAAKGTGSLTT